MSINFCTLSELAADKKNAIVDGPFGSNLKTSDYVDSGVPVLQGKNITGNTFSFSDIRYIKPEKAEELIRSSVRVGDILMIKIGSIGYAAIIDDLGENEYAIIPANLAKITPDHDKVISKYLLYCLTSQDTVRYLNKVASKTAQPALSLQKIKSIKIPLPPLETQKKIAEILDAADTLRQKTKTLIEKYNQLTQSLFLDMFGNLNGKKESLSNLCEINPKKSEVAALSRTMMVSFVPMTKVTETGAVKLDEIKTLDEVWNGFTYFRDNDVVFAKITPCMENGKGAIMRNLKNGIGFGTTEFHVLRPLKNFSTSEWLYFLTANNEFRKQAESNMTGSAGQKRVPKDFFKKYMVVCPPLPLQNQFAERVKDIEEQKAKAQASLAKSEELFQSLLQKVFRGEIN